MRRIDEREYYPGVLEERLPVEAKAPEEQPMNTMMLPGVLEEPLEAARQPAKQAASAYVMMLYADESEGTAEAERMPTLVSRP